MSAPRDQDPYLGTEVPSDYGPWPTTKPVYRPHWSVYVIVAIGYGIASLILWRCLR